ncbi:MAG: hypothetical protein Kow00128_05980 [Deltaproteobacteria bacterium]
MSGNPPLPSLVSPPLAEIDRVSSLCLHPPPGRFAGLFGPGAHRLALRALARPLLSGEPAVVVDGGNRFDPYEIAREERALGGSGQAGLSRLLVSRAFTCHQMEALLARRLAPALAGSGARFAVILGLPERFADADVPYAEACRVFRGCLSALRRIARGDARVILAGREEGDRPGFCRHLVRAADPCLLLRREGEGWKATLRRGAERAGRAFAAAGSLPRNGRR